MAEGGQDHNSGVADAIPTSLSPGTSGSAILAEGENVNLELANSTVNVVNGDQINANKVVFNISGAEGEAAPTSQALIKCVNDNATRKTVDKILEDFADEELNKPDFQVNPQMRRVSRSKYFKGEYEKVYDMEVARKKNWFWQKREVVKNQFRKEFGFLRQTGDDEKFITLDEVLLQDTEKQSSITAIVASAGSGKTTLMRRITRKILGYSLATTEAISGPSLLKYKMIHYIEIKDINGKGITKPSKFLFGGLYPNEVAERQAYQWLLENQSEVIIFFDGLDQATWKINNKGGDVNIGPFTSADASTIMYNILSRNLLADTKIVISSREFQVSDLPAKARPADIITLSGLSLDDAQKLFVFLIGHDGNKSWERIQQMSPRLINLVSIPVFLVLTAVIMAKDPTKTPPKTLTELYKRIIYTLSDVSNIRKAEDIVEIIRKLKAMAYRGMKEGRVVFYEKDLKMFGISKEEVHDLMMKVPGNKLLSRNLLEGDFIFFFCHQSLQEFLTAGFVVEMSLRKFTRFNSIHLRKERWSVVRRFVCGIIYDNSPDHLREGTSQMKRQVLDSFAVREQRQIRQTHSYGTLHGDPRALRSFLGHPRIESLSGNLLWEYVCLGRDVQLNNGLNDGITIDLLGRFNVEESSLSFEEVPEFFE